MPVPEELMPRTPKKEPDESGDFKVEKNNELQANKLPAKSSLNWRWTLTHILPIFLFVILIAGVSIAAVPSWRNAFNKFIAKYSPKADESTTCQNVTIPDNINNYNANLEWISSSVNGKSTPPADVVTIGDDVKLTINNQRPIACYGDNNKLDGVNRIDFQGLPPFNKEGWPIKNGKVVLPAPDPDIPDAIIDPNVQKLIDFDKITYPSFDTKGHFLSPSFTTKDYTLNPIQINYNHDINSENNTADIKFDAWMKLIPKNTKFNEISFVASIWWTGRGYAGTDNYAPSHHQIGGTYMDCVKNGSGSYGNMLETGNYTVTIHPYEAKNSWQTVKYAIRQELKNPAYPPTSSYDISNLRGYFYVNSGSFSLTATAPTPVNMESKKDDDGKTFVEGRTKITFETKKNDGTPVSTMVTIKNVTDSKGNTVDGSKFYYHNSVKTDSTTGKGEIEITSTKSGEFTFNIEASDDSNCTDSTSVKIKFIGYDLGAEIKTENPDYSADNGSKEKWSFSDNYLQVPVSVNNKTYRAKAEVTLKDGENPLSGENVNIAFIDDNGNDIANDSSKINIEGKNNTTDSNGKINLYFSSPKQEAEDQIIKGKIKATYTKDGVNYEATSKFIDANGTETENAGVEFISDESKISVEGICISPSDEQEKTWEEIATDIGMAKADSQKESWLTKLIKETKNKISSVLGLNDKAHSEDTTNQLCNDQISEIDGNKVLFAGNNLKLNLKLSIKDPKNIINQYGNIYIKFIQPVGTELNENALAESIKNINGKNGDYISYGGWDANGRIVKINITNKINNDKNKTESSIDSLIIEYQSNSGVSDSFGFKFELIGESKSASNSNLLIRSAKAISETVLSTSKEKKFKANKIKDAPKVVIEKIARDINNDNTIDESVETLKSPLNAEGKFIEGIPTNYDPDYLEKNNYFDVYKDGDKWKEKVFPGDKILYKTSYSNPSELNYVDFSAKVTAQAEEWDFIGNSEADKKEKDETNKKLIWTYDSIVPDYEVTNRYYVKLKSEIPKSNKNFGTYVVIGQNKLEYAYVSNPEKIADIWLKNDLWGKVTGTVKAAKIGTEENLSNVLVGIVADGQVLPSFKETYKNISDQSSKSSFLKKNMTNENGKYSLEYNRAKDFLNTNNFQIAVNYYDPVNKPVKSIRSSALGQKDVLYYETKNFELSEKGVQSQNIDMSMIKYPESSSPLWLQVQTASRIWINISKGTNIIEDAYGLKFDATKPIIVNLLPKTKNVNQETSYVKGNSIYLASYVWDASRLNASEDNGDVELHEWSELALKQNKILQSTSSNTDSEKYVKLSVPLVDEVKRGDCGKASAWTVVNYFNQGGDLKKQPMDRVTLNGGVDDLQDNWIKNHTVQNWIYNDKVSNVDFQAIRTSLYYGYPVVVYTAFYGMHVFVLTGYTYDNKTNSYIYFANDPQPPRDGVWPPIAGRIGTTRVNGITLTDSSLSRFMQIRTAMYPRDPGAYIYMPKSYAEKHPLRNIVKIANSDYFGYLNPNTNLSLKEGTAGYMSIDINNRIKYGKEYASYDWSDKMPNGAVKYYMDEFNPAFSNEGFDKKVTPAQESYSLSKLLKMIIDGGKGGNTFWFDETKFGITQKTFYESLMKGLDKDNATKKFFEIIKDKDPKDISELYDALKSYNIGQEDPIEITDPLDKIYISALSQIRDAALKKVGTEVEATPQPSTKLNSQIFSPYVENIDPDSAEKNWNNLCQNTEDCGRIESFPKTKEESDNFDYENVLSMDDYIYFGNKDTITSSGIYIGLYTGDNGEGGKIDNVPTVITVENNKVVAKDLVSYLNFESNDNYRIIKGVGKYVIDSMPVTETATLNNLDIAFIKNSAFFSDINGNWQYDPGEVPGKSANGTQFSANYSDISYQTEALDPIEMVQSSVANEVAETMGENADQYIQILNYKTISGEIFSDRIERQEIPRIPGSYIKFNFPGKDKNMITVKVDYDSPNESLNRSDSYSVLSGELSYFTIPSVNYHSKITITSDGYSDSLSIDSDNYWKTVLQDLNFNYIIEKTFGEISTSEKLSPGIDVTNPANESTDSIGGGETVIVNAENFDQSEKVEVYIGKNKIGEVSTLGKNFGLEVKVPDNIMLGTQTMKLLGNTGQEATSNIKITSNKYVNKVTIIIFFIFIILLAIAIYIYRKSNSRDIFQCPPAPKASAS
jgi:hypothetical protein